MSVFVLKPDSVPCSLVEQHKERLYMCVADIENYTFASGRYISYTYLVTELGSPVSVSIFYNN